MVYGFSSGGGLVWWRLSVPRESAPGMTFFSRSVGLRIGVNIYTSCPRSIRRILYNLRVVAVPDQAVPVVVVNTCTPWRLIRRKYVPKSLSRKTNISASVSTAKGISHLRPGGTIRERGFASYLYRSSRLEALYFQACCIWTHLYSFSLILACFNA